MSQTDSGNIDKLRYLLAREKERHCVAQTEVIFINSATIAKHSAARAGSNEYTNDSPVDTNAATAHLRTFCDKLGKASN